MLPELCPCPGSWQLVVYISRMLQPYLVISSVDFCDGSCKPRASEHQAFTGILSWPLEGKNTTLSTEAAQGSSHWKRAGGTGWRGGAGRGCTVRARLMLPFARPLRAKMKVLQLKRNPAAAQSIVSPALLVTTMSFPSE